MFSPSVLLAISVLSVSNIFSSALPSSLNLISSSLKNPAVFGTTATNSTSLPDLASPVLSYNPYCSTAYGQSLNLDSCNNALAKISEDTTLISFGERFTGTWSVVLPRRYLSDDGQCAIDVKVDPSGPQRDISNYLQITEAASAVIRTCVDDEQAFSTGGFANHLGIQRSLSVEIRRYVSRVECSTNVMSAPPRYDSCKEIIDIMQWSNTLITFGLPWQRGVDISVPYFLISADNQCKMIVGTKILIEPQVETTSWSNIWSTAVAINELCVKDGKGGNAIPPSVHGNVVLFFFGPGSHPSPEMLSSLNISSSELSMLSASNTTPSVTTS